MDWTIIVITVFVIRLGFLAADPGQHALDEADAGLSSAANERLKEKYKDDPVKMNKKTMEFMRENKVNPLGGCLPMLLQIPVFIGLHLHDSQRDRAARRTFSMGR